MLLGLRTSLIISTVASTVTLLAIIIVLPLFFLKIQRSNTIMLTQLYNCHQDSTDIWKQLSQENIRGRRAAYGRVDAPRIPLGKCCSCQQGPPGPSGPKGPDGDPGQPGMIGINGRNGRDGKYVSSEKHNEQACQKCPPAPPGPPGHPGRKGPRGMAGNEGTPGHNGIPGRDGPPGPSGVRGPPGEIGMQGPQGDPGKVLNGAPQGPPGKSGRVGPRGKGGLPGRDGRPGLEGIAGARGSQGERGSRGARGPPGPPGPSGSLGRKGSCTHCPTGDHRPSQIPIESNEAVTSPYDTADTEFGTTDASTEASTEYQWATPAYKPPPQSSTTTPTTQSTPVHEIQVPAAAEPQTLNYPDTVATPATHKHYGGDDDVDVVAPSGRYSSRQYSSKTLRQKNRPIGYSSEQLASFAPASFVGASYGSPRVFQTNKGYNVEIMGSDDDNRETYDADPVGSTWSNPSSGRSSGAASKLLSPPSTGPNIYA